MRLFFLLLILPIGVHGQSHYEFWSKFKITKQLDKHWDIGADLQFRQQSNFKTGNKDIFQYPYTRSIRTWAYFHLQHNWTLVVSPLAYFVSDEIKDNLGGLKKIKEIRFMGGFAKGMDLKKIKLNNRLLAEHRVIDINQSAQFSQWRYRIQNAFTIPLHLYKNTTGINYILSNEFFVKSQSHKVSFDQERLLNAIQWKSHHFDVDLGYQWTIQKSNASTQHRNQWLVTTSIII